MKSMEFNKLATAFLSQNLQSFATFVGQKHNISDEDLKQTVTEFLENHKTETHKKGKKARKDPNAPKKASTAFIHFSNSKRAELQSEGLEFKQIGKELGDRWRNLSEKEKKKFEKLAEDDKKRYEEDMKAYKSSSGPAPKEKKASPKKEKPAPVKKASKGK